MHAPLAQRLRPASGPARAATASVPAIVASARAAGSSVSRASSEPGSSPSHMGMPISDHRPDVHGTGQHEQQDRAPGDALDRDALAAQHPSAERDPSDPTERHDRVDGQLGQRQTRAEAPPHPEDELEQNHVAGAGEQLETDPAATQARLASVIFSPAERRPGTANSRAATSTKKTRG